jgi:hypothetical protein
MKRIAMTVDGPVPPIDPITSVEQEGMNPAILQQPIFQATLPVVIAMGGTVWTPISTNNLRPDDIRTDLKDMRTDMNTRFGEVNRLDHPGETLKTHSEKIAVLEERSSLLGR